MDDLYGLEINYPSITLYLNDKQILSSYYPKNINTKVQHDDICTVPEGGMQAQPSCTLYNASSYNSCTSIDSVMINVMSDNANDSMLHMEDSKSLTDNIRNGNPLIEGHF